MRNTRSRQGQRNSLRAFLTSVVKSAAVKEQLGLSNTQRFEGG